MKPNRIKLFQRCLLWVPTWAGATLLLLLLGWPVVSWWILGERFLIHDYRVPSQVLVVEGWIGIDGVQAAADEFKKGAYQTVITTGGTAFEGWEESRMSYAKLAADELARSGISKDRILEAPAPDTGRQRTFESAIAVWEALQKNMPHGITVFTFAAHARRTQLVFSKVFEYSKVGVIGWVEPIYREMPWWRSSERSKDFLVESVGYFYELLFNSGRRSNLPAANQSQPSPDSGPNVLSK